MAVTGHEASKDGLQSSMATSLVNMVKRYGSPTDPAPHDKTEAHETSQIDVSENTLQEGRPPLWRLLRLRNRSRLKTIAAVVSVIVSLTVIVGVAVWAVYAAGSSSKDQTSSPTSPAASPPSSSTVSLPSSPTAVSTVSTNTEDVVSTTSGLPIIFPLIVGL